ncbi:enoyl-CoA hydratase/isomerase family protein [Parasphingopyxis marina]|uniref:Enoyl-CoA hydratase/isomerase family protein n=1 Tax=Parasphingopyxis marina TaxID=2761622 RepID=A0A842I1D9_9SPHN|nr:enoyl-CoA hydratase/isomerase family protein [Parasphingopyxis marina]MBC2778965.1 enoyl-CoA hydratase/isomerase family protein [Parasphingopyxis marina]
MFETLAYSVADGIAVITLDRPGRHNAINHQMHCELPRVWEVFDRDPEAIVAIVTGSGEKAFCTGADVADLPKLDRESAPSHHAIRWTGLQNRVWKPVICAVNGLTVGGGLHFVADADIVLASENAAFCDSHVSVGLVAGLEPVSLARRMPLEAVLRLSLVGRDERMSADRALALGMVGEVVAPDCLMKRARELAASIAKNSPSAMGRTKRAIWQSLELPLHEALDAAWEEILAHNEGPDFAEGVNAFLERRAPRWAPLTPEQPDER